MTLTPFSKGFTLIEAVVATAVLGLGLALIFQGLFTSLNAYDYYANYLSILPRADEKLYEAQDKISRLGPQADLDTSGSGLISAIGALSGGLAPVCWIRQAACIS